MHRLAGLLLLSAVPLLSGCAAAVIPVVAGGLITKKKVDESKEKKASLPAEQTPTTQPAPLAAPAPNAVEALGAASPVPASVPVAVTPLTGPYARFATFALDQLAKRAQDGLQSSTVLVDRFALERPEFMPCEDKPAGVILDLDESQFGTQVGSVPAPGLANALARLRAQNVLIFWLTDLPSQGGDTLRERLQSTGLDPDGKDAILTRYDTTDRKHVRRQDIARTHCVIASAGDSKADVEEAYAYLRQPEAAFIIDKMWDAGWFLLPAPLTHETDAKDK